MADFELFNGTNLEEPDADHRIAMNKPSLAGAFFIRWDNFKNLIRSFTVSKDTDQSISGNKTFTGIVNVQEPTSDNNPVTLKYFNDNAGGGEEIIEVATYADLPLVGVISVLYVVLDNNVQYRWSGTVYVPMSNPLSYASQAEMELAEPIENTKVVTPLRARQGFMYWCTTSVFVGLSTTTKTIIGAINELKTSITNILIDLGLTATQNPGVCARCRIYPADIVVDPIAMTVSVVTVRNGQNISASCPLRFFTDGDGVIHKWEFYAPITASFTKINGIWGFYINQTGQVVCDQTPWSDFATVAPIYRFYLNDQLPNSEMIEPVCYEAHTTDTSASDREWMHAQGTIHVSGFDHVSNQLTLDANGRPTTAPNADGRNTVIALTTGKSSDDGLAHTVTNSTDGAQFSQDLGNTTAASLNATNSALFRIRTNDAVGRLSFMPATRFPFPWNTVNNSPQFITTTGVRTDVTDNRWFVVFVYDFPDSVNGRAVKVVTAPQDFTTYALAVAYQWESIQGAYATMRDKEIRPLYKDIYYCDKSGVGAYPAGCKYAAKCSTTDIRTLKPGQTSAAGGSVLASNVSVIPTTYFTATDQQTFDIDAGARIVKLESDETPVAINDTDTVRFKSATGYYVRTLLAIKNYVKLGLKASEVVNDSANVTGANLKLVLDNATLAIDGVTIQDGDLFPIAREVEAPAGVFTSVNMYHTWDRIKSEIKDTCGTYYIDSFDEFKTIVEDPLTPSDNITFYLSNNSVFIMVGTITGHTENIYVKSQNTSVYLATLTINTTLIDTPNRINFDGVCSIGDTEITITIPSETTTLFIKELAGAELYPSSLNILKSGAGYLQYNNATNISRSFLTNFDQYQSLDAIRQDEKWAYAHYRAGGGLDTVGKTIAKVTGKSDAYGNFSIKVRYRLCYNEADLVLPLFPATLPHGKWVRFERCDYCRDKNRGDGGIYVTPRGFEVAKFYKGDSDLVITNGVLSNEAGAGGLYENQYDDTNTYFSTLVRSTLAQSTFKVKYTDSVSTEDNDTWVIVHLRGVIL